MAPVSAGQPKMEHRLQIEALLWHTSDTSKLLQNKLATGVPSVGGANKWRRKLHPSLLRMNHNRILYSSHNSKGNVRPTSPQLQRPWASVLRNSSFISLNSPSTRKLMLSPPSRTQSIQSSCPKSNSGTHRKQGRRGVFLWLSMFRKGIGIESVLSQTGINCVDSYASHKQQG